MLTNPCRYCEEIFFLLLYFFPYFFCYWHARLSLSSVCMYVFENVCILFGFHIQVMHIVEVRSNFLRTPPKLSFLYIFDLSAVH